MIRKIWLKIWAFVTFRRVCFFCGEIMQIDMVSPNCFGSVCLNPKCKWNDL